MGAVVLFALISLALCLLLRQSHPVYAMMVATVGGVILLLRVIALLSEPLQALLELLSEYGVQQELITYLLKAFGICYLTKFATELCADFGQTSLSGKVELTGRVMLFVLSFPLMRQMLEWGLSLL